MKYLWHFGGVGGMNKLDNFVVTDSSKLELSFFFLGNGFLYM